MGWDFSTQPATNKSAIEEYLFKDVVLEEEETNIDEDSIEFERFTMKLEELANESEEELDDLFIEFGTESLNMDTKDIVGSILGIKEEYSHTTYCEVHGDSDKIKEFLSNEAAEVVGESEVIYTPNTIINSIGMENDTPMYKGITESGREFNPDHKFVNRMVKTHDFRFRMKNKEFKHKNNIIDKIIDTDHTNSNGRGGKHLLLKFNKSKENNVKECVRKYGLKTSHTFDNYNSMNEYVNNKTVNR